MPRPSPGRPPPSQEPITVDRRHPAPEQVYRALRQAILRLELPPGAPLSEPEIALRAGVSRTPVREAMKRLQAERLVEVYPNVGAVVAALNPIAVSEAALMRTLLEGEVAMRSAVCPDPALVEKLDEAIRQHERALLAGDTDRAYASDEIFHRALFEAQGFMLMWDAVEQARSQLERLHHLMVAERKTLGRAIEDHRRIVQAIKNADPAAARQAMTDHLNINAPYIELLRAAEGAEESDR
jgi:DNA-binding GntR family transcriptional regulator